MYSTSQVLRTSTLTRKNHVLLFFNSVVLLPFCFKYHKLDIIIIISIVLYRLDLPSCLHFICLPFISMVNLLLGIIFLLFEGHTFS